MKKNEKSHVKEVIVNKNADTLGIGWICTGIMYCILGVFAIFLSLMLVTLPLNVEDAFLTIGSFNHILGIRFGSSTVLFTFGVLNIIGGIQYRKSSKGKTTQNFAKLVGFINRPIIPLILVILSALWLVQAFEPDGSISEIFAPMFGLDVSMKVDALHYQYILSNLPHLEFLIVGLLSLTILPFTSLTTDFIMADMGFKVIKSKNQRKNERKFDFDSKYNRRALSQLFGGSIITFVLAGLSFGFGYLLGAGYDVTVILVDFNIFLLPILPNQDYYLFLTIYPLILLGIGTFLVITWIFYKLKPSLKISKVMATISAIILLLTPFYGFFFGIFLILDLISSKRKELGLHESKDMVNYQKFNH